MGILDRVKKLCSDRGISVGDLEKELEFSNGSIYKWIKTTPGADKVEKVADYFDVTVDYLLGRTAFKNAKELFEHWGHKGNHFEPAFDFGGLLQTQREEKNISQQEVAEKLNITVSDVDDIEEGIMPINSEWAEKFAKALGTTVEQMFKENEWWTTTQEESPAPNKPTTIAAHLPEGVELTEEEQKQLDDYIQFILSRRKK